MAFQSQHMPLSALFLSSHSLCKTPGAKSPGLSGTLTPPPSLDCLGVLSQSDIAKHRVYVKLSKSLHR